MTLPTTAPAPPGKSALPASHAAATGKAIVDNARRLGLQWTMMPATVDTGTDANQQLTIIYDGDTVAIQAMSLIGAVPADFRVMVIAVPPSGNFVVGALDPLHDVIGYASLGASTSTTTNAELAVMQITGIPLKAGVLYHIFTSDLFMDSTVVNDAMKVQMRFTTDGSTPTLSSTIFTSIEIGLASSVGEGKANMSRIYIPANDETLGLVLSIIRTNGTGNVRLVDTAGFTTEIAVQACGMAPSNTGVAL